MNLNSEDNYKAYFEAIATRHIDINYFRFGDDKDKQVDQRSGARSGIVLWLDYYPPVQLAGEQDNFLGTIIADITIMQAMSDKADSLATRQAKYLACEDIMQQLFAKIALDYQEDTLENQPLWTRSRFGRMTDFTFGATLYAGCTGEITFNVPLKMEHNPTKWI